MLLLSKSANAEWYDVTALSLFQTGIGGFIYMDENTRKGAPMLSLGLTLWRLWDKWDRFVTRVDIDMLAFRTSAEILLMRRVKRSRWSDVWGRYITAQGLSLGIGYGIGYGVVTSKLLGFKLDTSKRPAIPKGLLIKVSYNILDGYEAKSGLVNLGVGYIIGDNGQRYLFVWVNWGMGGWWSTRARDEKK